MTPPQRIACLSSETAEIVYALGAGDRVVARSAFCTRPEAVKDRPVVSSFTGVRLERLRAFEPDLILTFSDLQKDICRELVGAGFTVFALNQRSLAGVFQAVRWIGGLLGLPERAEAVVAEMEAEIEAVRVASAGWERRPRVYFEEWNDPLISGVGWVGEVIALAGGEDIFPDLARFERAPDRVVAPEEVIRRAPDVMLASWCGKPFKPDQVRARAGWGAVPAVRDGELHGLPGEEILSAGPGLVDGLKRIHALLAAWRRSRQVS